MEVNLNKENFEEEVLKSDKTVLVDFWATWCGPCQMIAPVVEDIAKQGIVKVGKVNVDDIVDDKRSAYEARSCAHEFHRVDDKATGIDRQAHGVVYQYKRYEHQCSDYDSENKSHAANI